MLESIVLQGVLGEGSGFYEVLGTLVAYVRVVRGLLKPPQLIGIVMGWGLPRGV